MTTVAKYTIGPPTKPAITHDNGFLDKFSKRQPTAAEQADYALWMGKLEVGEAIQGVPFFPKNDLPDALAAYRYFMEASGKDREFNAERYVENDSSGRSTLANVVTEAKNAAYDMYMWKFINKSVSFEFTGSVLSANSKNVLFPYPATENWQKTIGAFKFWVSGSVDVAYADKKANFDLVFTIHIEDRYNFNPGQHDIATGIPDDANGKFEITGLARQYTNVATLSRRVKWEGKPSGKHVVTTSDGRRSGRQRRPSDNRRVRNRL